jgi:hypothetical protein
MMHVNGKTSDSMSFQNINLENEVEIPVEQHVGAFGVQRKKHIHNGIDLYCEPLEAVYSVERGTVVDYRQWTGEAASSPWWNDTWAILVEGESSVVAYGEIYPVEVDIIGDKVEAGELIGFVKTVLKKDKGRPMTMLHLQCYKHGHLCAGGWKTNDPKPDTLIDPTNFLLEAE